ncbi:MAG: Flp family type IVb pilin [Candidatus Hydrothermarchaeaceae archaeon]
MIARFLKEERAQGSIEYILLAGGIIVAAVIIFSMYERMTRSAAEAMNRTTANATGQMEDIITNEIEQIY